MRRRNAALNLAIFALLSLILGNTALANLPPDNVQGDWTIYSTSLKNGETVVKHVQVAQYGNRITGYFEGPDQSGPDSGTSERTSHRIQYGNPNRHYISRTNLWRQHVGSVWNSREPCSMAGGASRHRCGPSSASHWNHICISARINTPCTGGRTRISARSAAGDKLRHASELCAAAAGPTRRSGCSHRALPRCAGSAGARSFCESRTSRIRRRLAGTKQKPEWHGARAGGAPATLGPQCQGFDAVPLRAG